MELSLGKPSRLLLRQLGGWKPGREPSTGIEGPPPGQ